MKVSEYCLFLPDRLEEQLMQGTVGSGRRKTFLSKWKIAMLMVEPEKI